MNTPSDSDALVRGEDHILELLDGFIGCKVLMTGYQLGVFSLVADAPLPAADILQQLELPHRSGNILLSACLALDLLEQTADGLRTPPALQPLLRRGADQPFSLPTYLIGFYDAVYDQLSDLDQLVRSDGRSSTFKLRPYFKDDVNGIVRADAEQYTAYMAETVREIAEVLLETVDLSGARHLLDLCGGDGTFARTLVDTLPGLQASFLDVPAVVELADPDNPCTGIGGDAFNDRLPEADLVTLVRSAHDWGVDTIEPLFLRIHERLPEGGRLLIIERMLPEQFDPAARKLYLRSIYFLVKSVHNEYRRPSDYHAILDAIGFRDIETRPAVRDPNRFFQGLHILSATK